MQDHAFFFQILKLKLIFQYHLLLCNVSLMSNSLLQHSLQNRYHQSTSGNAEHDNRSNMFLSVLVMVQLLENYNKNIFKLIVIS